MNDPLRLMILVPLRQRREFKQMLAGLKNSLCVSQIGEATSYDLHPTFKLRKGHEHSLILHLAEQLKQGWTLALWDVERHQRELGQIVNDISTISPKHRAAVEEAWQIILTSDQNQIVDLKVFEKLPNGHYVAAVAEREDFDFDSLPPRRRRRAIANSRASRPVSEDFWGVLHPLLMKKSEAKLAWGAYQRWVRNNRPSPPRADLVL